jgi:YebC/PmpR family DNA-binding regulatory protein
MSGHNKWSQIKHKKAKEDAKKGKAFTVVIKEITMAAKSGGGDPALNAHLRTLLEKARGLNMPLDNATRAIKRGTGELPGVHYEAITYEGYGPHGIAIIIDTLTDNRNRTVAELRHIFSSHGGNLGETGSVSWMFEHLGVITLTGSLDEDLLMEQLLDYDIKDIKKNDTTTVLCDPKSIDLIKNKLKNLHYMIENADIEWVAKNALDLTETDAEELIELLTEVQDHDDVQNVYSTLN